MTTHYGPLELFTGQWNDMPLETLARKASSWGYDGLEIDCTGGHLDPVRAAQDPRYLDEIRATLDDAGMGVWTLANHLAGHAVSNSPLDFRHEELLRPRLWGDGDPEGVHERAAQEMIATATTAAALGVDTVVGFVGSTIWQYAVSFPPVSEAVIEEGFAEFARRWTPILDAFGELGVRFALEVHPSEIAYDFWTARRALDAIDCHEAFGFNWDPSHMMWQGIDPPTFILEFPDRIFHVDCKDTRLRHRDGRRGILGSHLPWSDPRRAWDFVSVGRGDVQWDECFRALTAIDYRGPISVEWEDEGMNREDGAQEAAEYIRRIGQLG